MLPRSTMSVPFSGLDGLDSLNRLEPPREQISEHRNPVASFVWKSPYTCIGNTQREFRPECAIDARASRRFHLFTSVRPPRRSMPPANRRPGTTLPTTAAAS